MKSVLVVLVLIAGAPALAAASAPQPRKAVDPSFFSGAWYEIARTENDRQKDCQAPTYRFEPRGATTATFTLTCRKRSPTGPAEALRVTIRLPQDPARNKFKVTALGGLLSQEYWVLDIAEDQSWSILATPGGNYVWLLARRSSMDPAVQSRVMTTIRSMGYDLGKMELPRHG
jgi:apolipoprotein D and lipocalin family protein